MKNIIIVFQLFIILILVFAVFRNVDVGDVGKSSPESTEDKKCDCKSICARVDNFPLYTFSAGGSLEEVKKLLEQGADVDQENSKGATALFAALKEGELDVAKFLIKHGADRNHNDDFKETPLFGAIQADRVESVKFIVENGAYVNHQNIYGITPLMFSLLSKEPNVEIIKILLKHHSNFAFVFRDKIVKNSEGKDTTLTDYIYDPKSKSVKKTFKSSYTYDSKSKTLKKTSEKCGRGVSSKYNNKPIYLIAKEKNLDLIALFHSTLLTSNESTVEESIPMMTAAINSNLTEVKELLAKGADIEKENNNGETVLFAALRGEFRNS